MEIVDSIHNIGDSLSVVTHHIANESRDLTGYMTDSIKDLPQTFITPPFEHPDSDWSVIANLGTQGGIFIIVSIIIIGLLHWLFRDSTRIKNLLSNIVTSKYAFLFVWLYGFIVYDVGMCTGEYISLLTNAPMAIIYAFKIFIYDSDVSEIHHAFHESWVYSFNFALVHFLAAIISTLFLIKLFGFTIVQRLKMSFAASRLSREQVSETYVFWGINEAAYHLIESIKNQYKDSSDYKIIIIRTNTDNNTTSENGTVITRIFDFLSLPSTELDQLQSLGCLTDCTHTNLSTINVQDKDVDIIGSKLKMKSLKKFLSNKTTTTIHMLFLSDNEKNNLHDVSVFLKDTTIKAFVEQKNLSNQRQVLFYCHARYNSVHRVIEDQNQSKNLMVKVIDSSHINVEMLKLNADLLPVNFVKVEQDATVSTSFNALVVGFSEVGQDSVRFLYEFGAFVKSGSTDLDVKRSDFHMHVVDKRMADVAGPFVANAPAIKVSIPFIKGMENPDALITLHQMDCQSIEFYNNLETWIKTLNYIVIATDDDELNITLAIRIFKIAARYRNNMTDLCILPRMHQDKDGHIKKIAEYYNRLWMAQQAVTDYNGKIATQHCVKREDDAPMPIYPFGLNKDTYTYRNIIDDSLERQAVEFKERYTASTTPNYVKPTCIDNYAWHAAIRDNIECVEGDPRNNPTLSAIMGIRRMQGQDVANCFHAPTKILLAQKALTAAGLPEFQWELLSRKSKTVIYKVAAETVVAPQIFRILSALAQTEHLRWNASHQILGYVREGELLSRNEVRMHHSCITDWQNLTTEIQSYDYDIIDVTLNIINPDRPIENQ